MDLLTNNYFALFLIVALGFILGRIKIAGLSLDVSAVIFVALGFWPLWNSYSFRFSIPWFGVVYFYHWYSGRARFFESFKKEGRQLALFATCLLFQQL
jgi:putative transport protein